MKQILLFVTMMTANVFAVEKKELMPLIKEASTKQESAYVEVRNKIIGLGTNAIPILGEIAVDESLPWQQRLVARICYERIERKEDFEKLFATDWYNHPKYDHEMGQVLAGRVAGLGFVESELKEVGLWYYYLEQEWKMTGEIRKSQNDRFSNAWARWCASAVKDNPEERVWFLRVCSELTENTPPDPIPPPPPPEFTGYTKHC